MADVVISAADPLNLAGILLPGDRISPLSGVAIVFRNGAIVETGPYGALLASRRAAAVVATAHAGPAPAGPAPAGEAAPRR
jgi:hypothetical protein